MYGTPSIVISEEAAVDLSTTSMKTIASLAKRGMSAAAARKMEAERRKTARATQPFNARIKSAEGRIAASQSKIAAAESAARAAEAAAASRAKMAQAISAGFALSAFAAVAFVVAQNMKRPT